MVQRKKKAAPAAKKATQKQAPAKKAAAPRKAAPKKAAAKPRVAKPRAARAVAPEAEPLVEGFFVARVVSEEEARRHHLTEDDGRPPRAEPPPKDEFDERLGDLPAAYGDDTAVALPRDPHTAFVFWDFNEHTRAEAARGLDHPRAVLKVFDGDRLIREQDFALESRSFYVHGLPPGGHYRLEAHFVGRDGHSRRLGSSTATIALPRIGPSDDLTVRFLRLPWGLKISRLKELLRNGLARIRGPHGESYLELWRRVKLPGSGGYQEETLGFSGREGGASERPAQHP